MASLVAYDAGLADGGSLTLTAALTGTAVISQALIADTGLAAYAQARSTPHALPDSPLWGALFETCGVNEIQKQVALPGGGIHVYHRRSHGGAEVDLLIEKDSVLYPIEIKAIIPRSLR